MQLIIDIDDKLYETIKVDTYEVHKGRIFDIIRNGTPLPKGHGRLIDASYLLNLIKCEEYESCTWKNCSDCNREKCIRKYEILKSPTIIEAEREE